MKLNEIRQLNESMEVTKFFELLGVDSSLYKETPEGVDVGVNVRILFDSLVALTSLTEIPFQFNEVHGDFSSIHCPLTTWKGVPRICHGDLGIGGQTSCRITSLEGFSDVVKFIGPKSMTTGLDARLILPFNKITKGGIGIILIEGNFTLEGLGYPLPKQFQIIEKYLGQPDRLFECQAELIEAGLEEFAVL